MTFSIVARCAETGMFGVAVSSSSPAVAARCAFARSGVGAVASQNVTDPLLGPKTLELLALGASAQQAIEVIRSSGEHMEFRQVLAVDAAGSAAVHSGARSLGIFGQAKGENVACGGNLLANARIPQILVDAFSAARGHLGDRLLEAMHAAVASGGEAGPIRSAGIKIVRDVAWPIVDLRVDWTTDCPITGLSSLWEVYKPQLESYVRRALDPSAAPSYGVPGDP